MRKLILCAAGLLSIGLQTQAQSKYTIEQKQEAYQNLNRLSPEQWKSKARAEHKRVPATLAPAKKSSGALYKTTGAAASIPNDAVFTGEFEEIQGVFISWPYTYDAIPVIDTISASPMSAMYINLTSAIQAAGVKVYIDVWEAADTAAVKQFMADKGKPLSNYRFMIYEGDDIWARDFGPINYYYDSDDKIGWLDFHYYQGRDFDNLLPQKWGDELGIPYVISKIYQEGGNTLTDGVHNLATSDAVYDQNSYYYSYSSSRTRDSLRANMKINRLDVLKALPHDGGTGHIDLYLDMIDENVFVRTEMPKAMSTVSGFTDYAISNGNIDTLRTRKVAGGFPYYFRSIPFPAKDDGSWYTSAADYEYYTRTYSNHLIINKTILQPVFNDGVSGDIAGDAVAIEQIKKAYPGYTIIPIDMRILDGSGGSLHCITKEFVADNPVRFVHYPYLDKQPFQSGYPIDAVITNRSGIANAKLYWRIKGAAAWNTVSMTSAAGNHWLGNIPATYKSIPDTFQYYIEATSTNGKTISRPMPGAAGPYTFWYYDASGITEANATDFQIMHLYPNPANESVNIELNLTSAADVAVRICDMAGRVVASQSFGTLNNSNTLNIQTASLASGAYLLQVSKNGRFIGVRSFVKR